ncbi:uncharacterized protein LOC124636671 [Helicoverpa zea]|uniref:uncharacterized protein LOC124636671 n=1 Tax=Helicoverpa zea TaxID=7113 RepID=UPI001F56177A|nr:uncharacterized protein LOC124636671 [Helicoverpa zea]
MEHLLQRQNELIQDINRVGLNFAKDSANRKTKEYLDKRTTALDQFWGEFEQNHRQLLAQEDDSEYFVNNIFQQTKDFYEKQRKMIASYPPLLPPFAATGAGSSKAFDNNFTCEDRGTNPGGPVEELLSQQRTYFRALSRVIKRPDINNIEEKWEIEDLLKDLQHRWRIIDELHMRIDNILEGSDRDYEDEFMTYENMYNKIKRQLNRKLSSTSHLQQSTPKIDIPVFSGNYRQWPTFIDLFNETIHNNNGISNAQKMQYLKGKLRGEAERLIQHLTISAENYETARDLLMHRYNNTQILFTNQVEIFLSQPSVHRQSSFELKRLYDTTMESIHAIHNLGVDTTSWDPLIVHLICKKLDPETYSDYKQSRKSPRELPSFEELMKFIESKFTALEPLTKKDTEPKPSFSSKPTFKPGFQKRPSFKPHQAGVTFTPKCALCEDKHDLYQCKRFLNMSPETRLTSIAKNDICQNCLYKHNGKPCNSTKRCKYCHEYHNSIIHDDILQSRSQQNAIISSPSTSTSNDNRQPKPHSNKPPSVNHVAADDEEILLTTVSLRVRAADGNFMTLRALLDQGSQISLISENAAQTLGLQRRHINASVSGIGTTTKSGKGIVFIECQSIYEDYSFTTQALVISRVINPLPNNTFCKQSWPHLQNINLADPHYNVSKPIDLLLDASVYSDIIMSGLIKGPLQAPIAQQTRLGWILSGNVRTFNCHVVINEVDDLSKFWEIEGIQDNTSNLSEQDQYCEDFYQTTTQRLDSGRYQVALPMKQGFENLLGTSRSRAIMQFKQLEKRMSKNDTLSTAYRNFMDEYLQLGHMSNVSESRSHVTSMPTCYLPHHGV